MTISEYVKESLKRASRISLLMEAIIRAVEEIADVDVLMREVDDMLCVKISNIRTSKQYNAIKEILDVQFCESLMPVKATKTTLVYALPVTRRGV